MMGVRGGELRKEAREMIETALLACSLVAVTES